MEQNRLGPALAGTQHIAVRKTAASDQAAEFGQAARTGQYVAHVDVMRLETSAIKHGRHLDLTVDALFTQHRHARPRAGCNVRCSHIVLRIKAQLAPQSGVADINLCSPFFARTVGLITQQTHAMRGFAPRLAQRLPVKLQRLIASG